MAGGRSAAAVVDLAGALGGAPLGRVCVCVCGWGGVALGVRPVIRWFSLGMCCFAGRLALHGVAAGGVLALSAVLAGAAFVAGGMFRRRG